MSKVYTIGSDPEFFVRNDIGHFYPAFKIIKGTKANPSDLKGGYSVLYDNTLIEGNIPPAGSVEEFVTNMRTLKVKMNKILSVFKCEIVESDVEIYNKTYLEDRRALEFGCMPYMNAWTFEEEFAPKIEDNFRTAGMHVHVGYDNTTKYPNEVVNIAIARAFDFFAILPARRHKYDKRREESYGGFGKFRHKPYGLELRSLSGHFAADKYLKWVYERTIDAVNFVLEYDMLEELLDYSADYLNSHDGENKLGINSTENTVSTEIILQEAQKLVT